MIVDFEVHADKFPTPASNVKLLVGVYIIALVGRVIFYKHSIQIDLDVLN
jgi:hypothetical protein